MHLCCARKYKFFLQMLDKARVALDVLGLREHLRTTLSQSDRRGFFCFEVLLIADFPIAAISHLVLRALAL